MVPREHALSHATEIQSFHCALESIQQHRQNPHWGKNGNFLLKIEKSDIKIGPIFDIGPLVDTLAYPKIPFSGQDLV